MARSIKLLLVENVDNLGIVGDVVSVRLGYARNFLLPRGLATEPSEELLASLAERRVQAEKEQAALRHSREQTVGKLAGLEVTLERSCNDQGILYGSVSQQDLSDALEGAGYGVKPRDIRLPQAIKRVGEYDVHVKLDTDLACDIHLIVKPDRDLELGERDEMEFDNEGNLVDRTRPARHAAAAGDSDSTRGDRFGDEPRS